MGLQFAFFTPALALLLVDPYDATPADVGWVLAVYNAGGFVAALLIPAYADRNNDYLRPLLSCGALAVALPGVLTLTTTLPDAAAALIVVGGPAGVGMSLLFAHLKHSGAGPAEAVNTRAIVSFAWVAGPPLAVFIVGAFGSRPALLIIARLSRKFSWKALIASGCLAGLAYHAGMTFVTNPIPLVGLQLLHAWFFGVVAGVGLTLFQQIIPGPGLASGLFTNTRRLGELNAYVFGTSQRGSAVQDASATQRDGYRRLGRVRTEWCGARVCKGGCTGFGEAIRGLSSPRGTGRTAAGRSLPCAGSL